MHAGVFILSIKNFAHIVCIAILMISSPF